MKLNTHRVPNAMLKLILPVAMLFLTAFPATAVSCGSVEHSFQRMQSETDRQKLEDFLDGHICGSPINYSPDRADAYVAIVLINASRARVSKDKVQAVLSRYNCASLARNHSGYFEIKAYLGAERFANACVPEDIARVYVVTAEGGANLRDGPSTGAAKIGAIAEGVAVHRGKQDGSWVHVETYLGPGYMHISTLRAYLDTP